MHKDSCLNRSVQIKLFKLLLSWQIFLCDVCILPDPYHVSSSSNWPGSRSVWVRMWERSWKHGDAGLRWKIPHFKTSFRQIPISTSRYIHLNLWLEMTDSKIKVCCAQMWIIISVRLHPAPVFFLHFLLFLITDLCVVVESWIQFWWN